MSKKTNELEAKIRAKVLEMGKLNETEQMTEDQVRSWDDMKADVEKLNADLKRAKEQEDFDKSLATEAIRNEEVVETKDNVKSFYRALNNYIKTGMVEEAFRGDQGIKIPTEILRADPILTTTNTALVNKSIENSLSVVTGDDFSLLQSLGVQFYTGLTGTTELPYMAQLSSSKPTEGGDASTANADPQAIEMKPQTYSSTQSWSKMSLLNMPNSIYAGIINDMQLANERKVVVDYFSSIFDTDSSIAATTAGLTYGDMINLTNIDYNIGNATFVTDNNVRVYLEQKPVNSTGIALSWNALNNTIGGRKAISTSSFKSKRACYGNHSFGAVGVWGQPELVIDGITTPGKIKVTLLGFYKPVIRNKYAFKYFSADVSCAI